MTTDASASPKMRLLGDPPTLPLRVAIDVALSSIRVRLSRSLVTVSSVVLAVAFLLNVLGENVGNLAVYQAWKLESAPTRSAQLLRSTLERPRDTLTMLSLMATQPDELAAWHQALGGEPLTVNSEQAQVAVTLGEWIDTLSASQSYLICGNRSRDEWLLTCDSEQAIIDLETTAKQLKGVRLEIPHDRLMSLATNMPTIRAQLAALHTSEETRLERVADAGTAQVLLNAYAHGQSIDPLLAPLTQILPDANEADLTEIAQQISRDRSRLRAAEVVARYNAGDPSLLKIDDIEWAKLGQAITAATKPESPTQRIVDISGLSRAELSALLADSTKYEQALDTLNQALNHPTLYRRDAFAGIALSPEADALAKRVKLTERQRTRLNRLLIQAAYPKVIRPVSDAKVIDLRLVLDSVDDPALAALRIDVEEATDGLGLAALDVELRNRQRLNDLERTFSAIAFNPETSARKTFWLVVLSLLVCIVGIVNTMMMAVTERYREIATMKCLGAMDSFILKSFLIESGLVGTLGSALGAVIGLGLVLLQVSIRFGGSFWAVLPVSDFAAVAGFSLLCGMALAIFGALLPALKAARMHPIEAMRIEA